MRTLAALVAALVYVLCAGQALATTYTVNSTADTSDGSCSALDCTLREAVIAANANAGSDTINFAIPGTGVQTIATTSLIDVTGPVVIDGYSQPGASPNTNASGANNAQIKIAINSSAIPEGHSALRVFASGSTIKGLSIYGTAGTGGDNSSLYIAGANNLRIEGNYIGTDPAGTTALGPRSRINVASATTGLVIGGETAAARNVLSAVTLTGANGALVQGNLIGTNAAGTADLGPGGFHLLYVGNSSGVTVGGTTTAARNVISGGITGAANANGVYLDGASNTVIRGNYIGLNAAGTAAVANYTGILVSSSSGTHVSDNVISGNTTGVWALGTSGGTGLSVEDNYIGLAADGLTAVANSTGITLSTTNTSIKSNYISGNSSGVFYAAGRATAATDFLRDNVIGLNIAGADRGNSNGVAVQGGTAIIGGLGAGEGNVIAGNGVGVWIYSSASGTSVLGNLIGTDADGASGLGGTYGVRVQGISNNTIKGNTIASSFIGIQLEGSANSNAIQGNYIGTNAQGATLGNTSAGVQLSGAVDDTTIGGTSVGQGNVIAFNGGGSGYNVRLQSSGGLSPKRNAILGNSIYGPGTRGISLEGFTANDVSDLDTGANELQNHPVLARALTTGLVSGDLDSAASSSFTVEYFLNDACGTGSLGAQAKTLLGRQTVVTDSAGHADLSFNAGALTAGQLVSATATDASGNTSQISPCTAVREPQRGSLAFSSATYSVSESAGTATITVNRTGGSDGPVSVQYATSDGTAEAGSDYTTASGTLNFADEETAKTFTVAVTDDALDEADETLGLTLSNAGGGATLGPQSAATLTITDNDVAPTLSITDVAASEPDTGAANATFTVSLSAASSKTVTVDYATVAGTATAGDDYTAASGTLTFSPGQTSKQVQVAVQGDTLDEVDETFKLRLSNAVNGVIGDGTPTATVDGTGTIGDNDAEPTVSINDIAGLEGNTGTTVFSFRVGLSAASSKTVTVNWATANETASAPGDYAGASGTLTFVPGDTEKTLSVPVNGDADVEAAETFTVDLGGATNATISDAKGLGAIQNDDSAFRFSQATGTVSESVGQATITVERVGYTGGAASVQYATANDTASAPGDYTAASGTLSFAAADTQKTFTVTVVDDSQFESAETLTLNLSSPSGGSLTTPSTASLMINDDDTAPLLPSLSINDVRRREGRAGKTNTFTFTVRLSAPSTQNVTVRVRTANGTAKAKRDYRAKTATLTIQAGKRTANFRVIVIGDSRPESLERFYVRLSNPTNATSARAQGVGMILNDDRRRR